MPYAASRMPGVSKGTGRRWSRLCWCSVVGLGIIRLADCGIRLRHTAYGIRHTAYGIRCGYAALCDEHPFMTECYFGPPKNF
ncbi:MAG: hypothetical protein ACR2L2_14750 [Acidobacteriota bacterium]